MSRQQIIADIKAMTNYGDDDFRNLSEYQLLAMRTRISDAIDRYRKEIITFYKEHPELGFVPKEDIYSLNYNDLANYRRELGLTKKKVKKTLDAPHVAKKARESIHSRSTRDVARDIIVSEEQYEQLEMFRYMSEIREMGYGDYSREELARIGIIPLDMEEESHLKK